MPERDAPPPLLLLAPRGLVGWLRAGDLLLLALCAVVVGVFALPYALELIARSGAATPLSVLLTALGAPAAVALAVWALRRHAGEAELHADRVIVRRMGGDVAVVFFADLDAFDDASGAFVRLRRARGPDHDGVDVPVPTPTEDGRVALLAGLEAAGVPRDDDARRSAPARQPPPADLVVEAEVAAALLPRRAGRVVLDRRGVRIVQDQRALSHARLDLSLAWDDVVAVRVGRPDLLRLVLRPGLLRRHVFEPIAVTHERRRLLEALTARGVPTVA
ncbi:MAG: hypothetical protein KF878_37360 [Planctomycetes bacterium]|nr:hypothetical protein [Planctomycetota bacterium]